MIITRTPLRVSFLGGGSDLPYIYENIGQGKVFGIAIDKYIYQTMHYLLDTKKTLVKYSKLEYVEEINEIEHPTVREVLKKFSVKGVDIGVTSDFPAGTGMGSSSSFTVGLINLITNSQRKLLSKDAIAQMACSIEIDTLNEPIGKQDHYFASFGGVKSFEFASNGKVSVESLDNDSLVNELKGKLHLVRVGKNRSAAELLLKQKELAVKTQNFAPYMKMIDLVYRGIEAYEQRDLELLGHLINLSWQLKRGLGPDISTGEIDDLHQIGMENGAWGGKLLGAGNSGFMFFIGPETLKEKLAFLFHGRYHAIEVDSNGSVIIYNDK
jgi:D-glycero-alpha-D-manno-heptose-7-phosphate kinase